jgi:hypothetical protein
MQQQHDRKSALRPTPVLVRELREDVLDRIAQREGAERQRQIETSGAALASTFQLALVEKEMQDGDRNRVLTDLAAYPREDDDETALRAAAGRSTGANEHLFIDETAELLLSLLRRSRAMGVEPTEKQRALLAEIAKFA